MRNSALRSLMLIGLALLVSGAPDGPAVAQQRTQLREGERIRVSQYGPAQERPPARRAAEIALNLLLNRPIGEVSNVRRFSGTIVAASDDSIVIKMSPEAVRVPVALASIVQLDVDRRTPRRLVRPALIGAGAAAVAMGVLAYMPAPCFGHCSEPTLGEVLPEVGQAAVLGAVAGAAYGMLRPWQRVRLPVTVRGDGRVAITASAGF